MEENETKREDIKVVDRRMFTSEGERRTPDVDREQEPAETAPPTSTEEPGFQRHPVEEPEGVDFTMLINAMAHPALIMLGEIPHPETGSAVVELEQARLQIDLLDLLRVKCRGNLTVEEERLLEKVLYQLRMIYVERSSSSD